MNQLTGKITWSSYFTATENEELSVWKLSVRTPKRFHSAFCLALFRQAKSKSLFPFCCLFAANRRKRERTNRFNGERGNWKKKTKMLLQQRKHQKCTSFVEMCFLNVLWYNLGMDDERWSRFKLSTLLCLVKRRKNTSIFNDLPSLITA